MKAGTKKKQKLIKRIRLSHNLKNYADIGGCHTPSSYIILQVFSDFVTNSYGES